MINREKHYLEEGLSKSAIARKLEISHDAIHRLIHTGQLIETWTGSRCDTSRGRRLRRSWRRTNR